MTRRLSVSLHTVSVRRGTRWALRDVSLRFEAGERWALIGGNGAGKTQLLKLLAADVWPTPTGHGARTYSDGGREVDVIEAKTRIAYVGAELQDKYSRYEWNHSVRDLLATGLHKTDLLLRPANATEGRRIAATLERCGLTPLGKRRFLSLSYGQKRLALLARALVQRPDWLLLDEFYNGLDANFRRRLDRILEHAARRGQSWIASAHRALDVPGSTVKLAELNGGRVRSIRLLEPIDRARLAVEALEEGKRLRAPRKARRGPVLIRILDADVYVDYRRVLHRLNWELYRGEHWAVFGANGAGKSTFLKLLYGDLSPALGGRIERSGYPLGTPIQEWKRRVGFVSPELQTDYAREVTVLDLVASGRYASIGLADALTAADLKEAKRWLQFFALKSLAQRRPRELSYGQMRRALFARALAANPRLLLLDEPLTGLDPRQRGLMKRLLKRLMTQGRTLILAVHHPEDLPPGMTHALNLDNRLASASDSQTAT